MPALAAVRGQNVPGISVGVGGYYSWLLEAWLVVVCKFCTWTGPDDQRERGGRGDGQGNPAGLLRRRGGAAPPPRWCCGGRCGRGDEAAEAEHGSFVARW